MPEILIPIATFLSISSADVIMGGFCFILLVWFIFLGSGRLYSALFSSAIGLGIYLVLGTLLLSQQANPNGYFIPLNISGFIVGSSAYLPIILGFLGFMGNGFGIKGSSHKIFKFIEPIFIGTAFLVFLFAVFIGLVNKSYVFGTVDTFFPLIKKITFVATLLQESKFLTLVSRELRTIIVTIMLFVIYKWLFADIAESMISAAIKSILKARKWGSKPQEVEAESHEEFLEDDHEDEHHGH